MMKKCPGIRPRVGPMRPGAWLALLFASLLTLPILAQAQSFSWLQNRWKPDQYIHIERGGSCCR